MQLHAITPAFEGQEQHLQKEVSDKGKFPIIVVKPFLTKNLINNLPTGLKTSRSVHLNKT